MFRARSGSRVNTRSLRLLIASSRRNSDSVREIGLMTDGGSTVRPASRSRHAKRSSDGYRDSQRQEALGSVGIGSAFEEIDERDAMAAGSRPQRDRVAEIKEGLSHGLNATSPRRDFERQSGGWSIGRLQEGVKVP